MSSEQHEYRHQNGMHYVATAEVADYFTALQCEVDGIPNAMWPKWTADLQAQLADTNQKLEQVTAELRKVNSAWATEEDRAITAEAKLEQAVAALRQIEGGILNADILAKRTLQSIHNREEGR